MPPAESTTPDQTDASGPDEPDSSLSGTGDDAEPLCIEAVYQTDITGADIDGWLDAQILRAVKLCGVARAQLALVVVADDEMAQLHEQYTGVSGTTDVLTFDMSDDMSEEDEASDPDEIAIEGDIIVCLDEARRQAAARGHEPRLELLLYAVHGLMHLLGEDDHDENDYQRMHAREDALLRQMGFGPLFFAIQSEAGGSPTGRTDAPDP